MKLYWTSKGRVVYDRKKHVWNVKDLIRIGKSVGARIFEFSAGSGYNIEDIEKILARRAMAGFETHPRGTYTFGGGAFGGAGASGSFEASSVKFKITILIEEI